MARLIDAEALEKSLHDLMERRGVKSWMSPVFDAVDFETLIDDAPTVEAEPVKHGDWEDGNDWDEWYGKMYKCSICGGITIGSYDRYCSSCGAKMRVEEADE